MNQEDIQTVLAVKQVLTAFGYAAEAEDLIKIFAKIEQPEVQEKIVEKIHTVVQPHDKERANLKQALVDSGLYPPDGKDDFESLTRGIETLAEKFTELATSPEPEAQEKSVDREVVVSSVDSMRVLAKMFKGTPTGDELEALAEKLHSALGEEDGTESGDEGEARQSDSGDSYQTVL